jgi:hypothetical protein
MKSSRIARSNQFNHCKEELSLNSKLLVIGLAEEKTHFYMRDFQNPQRRLIQNFYTFRKRMMR